MNISQISAGRDRSVLLADTGMAFVLGGVELLGPQLPPGYPGELCISKPTEIGHRRFAQPTPLAVNPGRRFASIADGHVETLAVQQDGRVVACRPVLSREQGAVAVPVHGLPAAARQLVASGSAAFALYADGAVWSWGMDAQGQLGRPAANWTAGPARIAGLPPITALAAGHAHVLALDRTGAVWAWGANGAGQLGVGDLRQRTVPVRLELARPMRQVAAGDTHSFAVDDAGQVWGWGANNFGQVGDVLGPRSDSRYFSQPRRVRTGFRVARMDGGMFYSAAVSTAGEVFAWGWNGMGQLGQPGLTAAAQPQRIRALREVRQLAAGQGHVLALGDDGVFAWGDNRSSACGALPTAAVQLSPQRIELT